MMKRVSNGIPICAVFTLLILGLWVGHGQSAGPEITLRFAGNLPVNHFVTHNEGFYAKLVMEKTKGKVKVEHFPAGQLLSDKDLMRALPSGAVDMGEVTCAQWAGLEPLWVFLDLALYYKDRAHWHRVLDMEPGALLKQEFEKKTGVKVLYWIDYGSVAFASKYPLRTLEDFKGRRIRSVGEGISEAIKALGSAPVFMGGAEVYMALQRGTVDGAVSGVTSFWDRKYYEVTKYISAPDIVLSTHAVLINKKKWDSLPGDVQKAMLDAAEEAKDATRRDCEKEDNQSLALLKEKGMDIYDPPEQEKARWRAACKPVLDLPIKRAGEKGKLIMELGEKLR
jgi:tripartite ATP-independent transporter DctP family solute receptor